MRQILEHKLGHIWNFSLSSRKKLNLINWCLRALCPTFKWKLTVCYRHVTHNVSCTFSWAEWWTYFHRNLRPLKWSRTPKTTYWLRTERGKAGKYPDFYIYNSDWIPLYNNILNIKSYLVHMFDFPEAPCFSTMRTPASLQQQSILSLNVYEKCLFSEVIKLE